VEKDTPKIQIFNAAGKLVAQMGHGRGPFIHFMDSKGIPRVELSALDTGARLSLLDEHMDRAEINVTNNNKNPALLLRDEKGRKILEVLKEGPKLTFFGRDGKPLFTRP
jgi:hypothetical protein